MGQFDRQNTIRELHVFDQYHASWFPFWCVWGISAAIAAGPLSASSVQPFAVAAVPVTWLFLITGTVMSSPRGIRTPALMAASAGFILVSSARILSLPTAGAAAAGVGFLLLLLLPQRSDGFPETGPLSTEWISGAVLVFQMTGPAPIPGLSLIAGMRFAVGLVNRLVPVHRQPNQIRTALEMLSWLPVWILLPAGLAAPDSGLMVVLVPAAVFLRAACHLYDGVSRLMELGRLVPRGSRAGLFRTFIIYYRIPLRRMKMKRFYSSFLPSGGQAFDVGAHLGNRSRIWLNLGMNVTAVEPQPACAALLTNWFGSCSRFTLVSKAVGSGSGSRTLHLSGRYPTLASVSDDWVNRMSDHPLFRKVQWETDIEVEQTTLSALSDGERPMDFIKVDVEGSEADVLAGMDDVPAALSFEYLPADRGSSLRCLDYLGGKSDWKWNVSIKERFRFVFPEDVDHSRLQAWLNARDDDEPSGDIYGWRIDEPR